MPEDPPDSRRRPLTALQQEQVAAMAPWARSIAVGWCRRVPRHVSLDDLASAAYVALCQAVRDYSPNHGATLNTYAGIRINGAIRDNLRLQDWMSRGVRDDYLLFWGTYERMISETNDIPSPDEVLATLSLSPRERQRVLLAAGTQQSSLEHLQGMFEVVGQHKEPDPAEQVVHDDLIARIHAASLSLPERHQVVYREVIMGGRSQVDVSRELGVTAARVNQMIKEISRKIRVRLEATA